MSVIIFHDAEISAITDIDYFANLPNCSFH